MMNKEFIPYEEALAMKELGFNEKCLTYYFEDGTFSDAVEEDEMAYRGDIRFLNHRNSYEENVSAPLYQQVFRWFRKNHDICSWVDKDKHGFSFMLYNRDYTTTIKDTYEEAELACLKKLIEIVKSK